MNYLAAKAELLRDAPKLSLKLIALEAATMVGVAGVMVLLFA